MASNAVSGMIEDIHICGACREEFHDVELFIVHKRTGCPQLAKRLQSQQNQQMQNVSMQQGTPQLQSPLGQVVFARMTPNSQNLTVLQAPPNMVTSVLPACSQDNHVVVSGPSITSQPIQFAQSHVVSAQNFNILQAQANMAHQTLQHAQPIEIIPTQPQQTATHPHEVSTHTVQVTKEMPITTIEPAIPVQAETTQSQVNEMTKPLNMAETMKVMQEQTNNECESVHHVQESNNQEDLPKQEPEAASTTVNLSQNGILIAGDSGATIVSEHQGLVTTTIAESMSSQGQVAAGQVEVLGAGGMDGQATVMGQGPQITLDIASLIGGLVPGNVTADGSHVAIQTTADQTAADAANQQVGTVPGTIQINLTPGSNNLSLQNLPATLQAALQAGLGQLMSQAPAPQPQPEEQPPPPEEKSPPKNIGTTATPGTSPTKKARYETYNVPAQRPMVIVPTPKKYQCDYEGCGYSTSYQKDLERHQRIHTGEKPYECSQCGKAYNRSDKLRIHERNHSGVKPYKCQHCEYSTSDSSSLKKHLRIHTDERPFRCQICPYASRNSSQLIVHLRTHTGDCPFVCHVCNAKFKINSDLKRHMRLHTGEKPYKCDLCDYKCAIKGNLKSHYRINHSQENMVTCKDCGYQTSSRKAYREHLKSHEPNYHYSCQYCSYTCVSRATLRTHLRIHSEEKPYRCEFCNYATKQSGNVKMHMKRKHPGKLSAKLGGKAKEKEGMGRMEVREGPLSPTIRATVGTAPGRTSPESQGEDGAGKRAANIRPVCKKMFKCPQCDLSFVREDSLRCHLRCHKETDSVIAQAVESAAFAVLQLQHPVSNIPIQTNNPRKEGDDGLTDHSYQGRMDGGRIEGGGEERAEGRQDSSQILQTALSQSEITPITLQQQQQQPMSHGQESVPTTTSQAQHDDNMLNQAASSLMAFMQNNQNMAVEDNIQNHAISRQQLRAQQQQPQPQQQPQQQQQQPQQQHQEVTYSTHTIPHHPVTTPRVNEHHYANQAIHQGAPRYTEAPPAGHQGMGRPINLSMGSGMPLNVQIMGTAQQGVPSTQAPVAATPTSQPIQFILAPGTGGAGTVPMTNPQQLETSMTQGLVLNVGDGQRGVYSQPRPPSYPGQQQTYTHATAISHTGHITQTNMEVPPPIATVDFSSLTSPPPRQEKGMEKKHGGGD